MMRRLFLLWQRAITKVSRASPCIKMSVFFLLLPKNRLIPPVPLDD